jgi:predicted nuclease with TOPRIM domain
MEFVNKIYFENEELKKKINELQIENKKISNKLEETKKDLEQSGVKKIERINNLFKDSAIVKNDEKKMINDWIDPYGEKNMTSELLFKTSVNGDSASTFHQKCDGKGATITFIKTTNGKRIGGFTMIPWTNAGGDYKRRP